GDKRCLAWLNMCWAGFRTMRYGTVSLAQKIKMKEIHKNHPKRTLLSLLFLALSLRAQSSDPATFSLAPGDVIEATIGSSGRATLRVTLTPQKSAEFSVFTGRNLNKQVTILVAGKLRSQPFIREQIAGPSMEIFVSSEEDAIATVNTLL